MIDQQQQADEALLSPYVRDLRYLSTQAHTDAAASVVRLAEEVALRLPPNAHRYELLARQQHTALLAATAAAALEEPLGTYDLVSVVEGIADGYLVTHSTGRDDLPGRACRHAAGRVVDTVRQTARDDADRFADDDDDQ